METQKPFKTTVTVEEVNKQRNEVYINDNNGSSGWFPVVAPANINYAKIGEAEVTINGGNITYLRSTAAKSNFQPRNNYPKREFKPYTQRNPVQPVQANDYQAEEKESKRIGMTKEKVDTTLEEIRIMYNSLSINGKWIVATNIFPRADKPGRYDCMFFISEKREGFDPVPYMEVPETDIDSLSTQRSEALIREESMGEM